jgi:hypothetical protein
MRADLEDRIVPVDLAPPSHPAISIPRIFGVGLILPFAHPIRLVLSSVVPVVFLVAMALGPLRDAITTWQQFMTAMRTGATGSLGQSVSPVAIGRDLLEINLIVFVAVALFLCAWQRAAARGFKEPTARWLGGSLVRFPEYILALALWLLAPMAIMWAVAAVFGSWIRVTLRNSGAFTGLTPGMTPGEIGAFYARAITPAQWWAIGLVTAVTLLLGLWLSARLAPLPAMVARQGWRRSLGPAWRFSRGHGFGLAMSLVGYWLCMLPVAMIAGIVYGIAANMTARSEFGSYDSGAMAIGGLIFNVVIFGLLMLWQGSLGALVVRDAMAALDAIDPATFD